MTRNESEAKRLMSSAAGKAAVASEIKDLRSHSTVYHDHVVDAAYRVADKLLKGQSKQEFDAQLATEEAGGDEAVYSQVQGLAFKKIARALNFDEV